MCTTQDAYAKNRVGTGNALGHVHSAPEMSEKTAQLYPHPADEFTAHRSLFLPLSVPNSQRPNSRNYPVGAANYFAVTFDFFSIHKTSPGEPGDINPIQHAAPRSTPHL